MKFSISIIITFANFLGLSVATVPSSQSPSNLRQRAASYQQKAVANAAELEGYAFLYFIANVEQIFLAASNGNDALSFMALNDGMPILNSTHGEGGVRDPFVMRSVEGDKFFIIATDLCTRCGTSWDEAVHHGSQYVEVWETEDFVTFSSQRHVLVSPQNYGNSWAPEAYFDEELNMYVMYWASAIYDEDADPNHEAEQYQRIMYATTNDFVAFSDPVLWQDESPMGRIDSTVIVADGIYHRFTKATTSIATCIGKNSGTANVEGPSIFKTNLGDVKGERYILLVDEYGGGGYVPLESTDIASGEWVLSDDYNFPTGPRHGTIIPLTAEELNAVIAAWS